LYVCQNNIYVTKITFMSKSRECYGSLSRMLPHFYTLSIESTLTVLRSHWTTLTDFAQEREMLSTLTKTALAATTALIIGLAPIATADLALAHGGGGGGGSHMGGGGGHFGGGFHGGGFRGGSGFHGAGVSAFHRSGGRARGFFGGYGYGYDCGFGFDCGVYDYGYGYGGGGGAGNAVSSGGGFSGGYVPDPVGAEIPPVIFPTSCWVRRAGYDPSGAHVGQVLIDLCRPSDSVTVTGLKARAKAPDTGTGTGKPAPLYRSGAPQSPP
jgi:hypothetical protein